MTTPAPTKQTAITDDVLSKIQQFKDLGTIRIAKDYSPENALRAALFMLQETKTSDKKPVLEACSKDSIANALLKMVTQGLNPAKRQCSFVAYGNQLTLQREYAGSIAIAKRVGAVKNVIANAVFKDDVFTYKINPETFQKEIVEHTQSIENLGGGVKGAYAIVIFENGDKYVEVMSMPQIQQAWNQGATKGQSPAHKNFPDQMAMKTVINRALKIIINSSDDADLFDEDDQPLDSVAASVQKQVTAEAHKEEISFDSSAQVLESKQLEQAPEQTPTPETTTEQEPTSKAPF